MHACERMVHSLLTDMAQLIRTAHQGAAEPVGLRVGTEAWEGEREGGRERGRGVRRKKSGVFKLGVGMTW